MQQKLVTHFWQIVAKNLHNMIFSLNIIVTDVELYCRSVLRKSWRWIDLRHLLLQCCHQVKIMNYCHSLLLNSVVNTIMIQLKRQKVSLLTCTHRFLTVSLPLIRSGIVRQGRCAAHLGEK